MALEPLPFRALLSRVRHCLFTSLLAPPLEKGLNKGVWKGLELFHGLTPTNV